LLWFCHDFDDYLIYIEETLLAQWEKLLSEKKTDKDIKIEKKDKLLFLVVLLWGKREKEEERRKNKFCKQPHTKQIFTKTNNREVISPSKLSVMILIAKEETIVKDIKVCSLCL
jgi:hypothetical protein